MKNLRIPLFIFISLSSNFNVKANAITNKARSINNEVDTIGKVKTTRTKGYEAKTSGISFSRIETYMDKGTNVGFLYYNIRFTEVSGLGMENFTGGKLTVSITDKQDKNIPLPKEARFYVAKTHKQGEQINILISIPLNPADANNARYKYSFSLLSASGKQVIDMKGKVGYQ